MSSNAFKPAVGLKNPHLQTIIPSRFRKQPTVPTQRRKLDLIDGDFIHLDIFTPHLHNEHTPILLLLHGLEGSSDSQYIQAMLRQCQEHNWIGAAINYRGCSGELNNHAKSYHSGETEDVDAVLHFLKEQHPSSPICATGYSLGGSSLLNWLTTSSEIQLFAACGVSVPYDLAQCARQMNKGFSRVYRNHFMSTLHEKARNKSTLYDKHNININFEALKKSNDFWVFDHYVTAPAHGFESADHYYESCSSLPKLKSIKTPTLLVHAKDDPFMTEHCAPHKGLISDSIQLEISDHGGHLGFVSGSIFNPDFSWLENRVMSFLLEQHDKQFNDHRQL